MPQPLQHYRAISFLFIPDALMQRPKLAPYIGIVSAHWNNLEARMAIFLAALAGAEAKTVISVFLALRADTAKLATINTIVEMKLNGEALAAFREHQKTIGKRYSERNTVVHGAWGISPEYPEDILWSDIRDLTAMFPEMMALAGPTKRDERAKRLLAEQKNIKIYKERDFIAMIDRFKKTFSEFEAFTRPYVGRHFV